MRSLVAPAAPFFVALSLLAGGCHHEPPEQVFWKWFTAHSADLLNVDADRERLTASLGRELRKVNPLLTCEVGPKAEVRELRLSANGATPAFPVIATLIASAPPLPGWKLSAFRPRGPLTFRAHGRGVDLGADDVWFRALPRGDKLDLILYLRGLTRGNTAAMTAAGYQLVDNALGEYDAATRLGVIGQEALPPENARANLRPFRELTVAVDELAGHRASPEPNGSTIPAQAK